MPSSPYFELLDWRRRVAELFAELRQRPPDAETLAWFRQQKDRLFKEHPQSPIPESERPNFSGLSYWPFDPSVRVAANFLPLEAEPPKMPPGEVAFRRIGDLEFQLNHQPLRVGAFWIAGYAGGLFVPFKDATSNHETYGGARYLLDTVKSADLGSHAA